jgi:hypothetical protein
VTTTLPSARILSISSVVIGVASVACGFALFPEVIGVLVGVVARRREPSAQRIAAWGIALNAVTFIGWVVVLAVLVLSGTMAELLRP